MNKLFDNVLPNLRNQVRHILLNFSSQEQCFRHPDGPVGMVLRDQGQVDIYAGKCKSVLSLSGDFYNTAINYSVVAERINLRAKSITNLKILDKHFNKKLHEGQKVLAIKPDAQLSQHFVIGPNTKVLVAGVIGEIILPVPILDLFDERLVFEEDPNVILPKQVQIHNKIDAYLKEMSK